MSGIGHLAAGFAAKPLAPSIPLWVLLAASETNDILYFVFTSAGVEQKASTTMDFTRGVTYLSAGTNPWSHGLFMSVVWSLLAAAAAFAFTRSRRAAAVLGLVVFSHWLLDFIMHSNLPLLFNGSPLLGLGLENSGPGFIFMTLLDLSLIAGSIAMYLMHRNGQSLQIQNLRRKGISHE
jgi:membrane-bound metal-dependent hydrolase YbcI (DUF457 family)